MVDGPFFRVNCFIIAVSICFRIFTVLFMVKFIYLYFILLWLMAASFSHFRRRGTALMNGTSDGEENTPDSRKSISPGTTPTKTRAAALAKAIQEQGEGELNVRI